MAFFGKEKTKRISRSKQFRAAASPRTITIDYDPETDMLKIEGLTRTLVLPAGDWIDILNAEMELRMFIVMERIHAREARDYEAENAAKEIEEEMREHEKPPYRVKWRR